MKLSSPKWMLMAALTTIGLLSLTSNSQTDLNNAIDKPDQKTVYEEPIGKYYTGKTPYMGRMEKKSAATPAPKPVPAKSAAKAAPAPAQATGQSGQSSAAKATNSAEPVSNTIIAQSAAPKATCADGTWGLVKVSQVLPAEAGLGAEYVSELRATAAGCAANVVIRETIPAGASYVRSEPAAVSDGTNLTWNLGNLDAGETRVLKVVLKAEKEGTLTQCAVVSADPRVCGSIFVGKPALTIDKSGPETALIGSEVTYNVVVKNTGTAVAKGVVVTDVVPTGLSHSSGKSELTFDVGDLNPGQSKPLAVTLKANQRGKVCNTATANSSNAGKVSDDACTTVLVPGLKVEKTGTKEQILGRNADYEIVVSNTGDTTLQNVAVNDVAPAETTIVAAPGATIAGNRATWTVASLAPGAKVTQTIKLTSKVAGTHCNTVSASSGSLNDSAKACTLWKGIAAVLLEVVDDPDPIQVGESTTYTIKVTNQGFADIHNVKVGATFGDQVLPVSTPQGTVNGKAVSFPTIATIGAKQSVTYKVTVKGASVGDSRNKIVLTADELKTPVEEGESTTVY